MDKKNDLRKANRNSSILLFVILIGFCILAIIEILYGQAQTRMEQERLALEEENRQAVQELQAERNNLQGDPGVGVEFPEKMNGEQISGTEPEKTLTDAKDTSSDSAAGQDAESGEPAEDDSKYAMQIVVMGDSIMADQRENNQDVATLIGEACNAKVYNLSIGGTTAALMPNEPCNFASWSSRGLLGVVNAIVGNINPGVFDGYDTEKILRECDFSKTDYFVIEYGINDFLSRQVPQSIYLENGDILGIDNTYTYAGAMEVAVDALERSFPDAKILIVPPHYCQFYEGTAYVGDSYSLNYGYGTLVEFFGCARYVADRYREGGTIFFDSMEDSNIDAYTADKYLEDGTHLTTLGRRVYADEIAKRINRDFYREE